MKRRLTHSVYKMRSFARMGGCLLCDGTRYQFFLSCAVQMTDRSRDIDGMKELLTEYKETVFGCLQVDSFYLMKSALQRSGLVYTEIRRFSL
jgi:hypothetical protein